MLVIGLAAALSMTLFFNITEIVVNNETDTPDEQIVELSGIRYQDNLIRLDTVIAAERVRANIAYAEKVTVKRRFPSTVEINVERAVPVANITAGLDMFWLDVVMTYAISTGTSHVTASSM